MFALSGHFRRKSLISEDCDHALPYTKNHSEVDRCIMSLCSSFLLPVVFAQQKEHRIKEHQHVEKHEVFHFLTNPSPSLKSYGSTHNN